MRRATWAPSESRRTSAASAGRFLGSAFGSDGRRPRPPPPAAVVVVAVVVAVTSVLAGLPPSRAAASPTNPMGFFLRYSVGWLNAQTGQFGGNLTISRPAAAAATAEEGWAVVVAFPNNSTAVQTFSDPRQFTVVTDRAGTVYVVKNNETDGPAAERLRSRETAQGAVPLCVYLNVKISARHSRPVAGEESPGPANRADFVPSSFFLALPSESTLVALVEGRDFAVEPPPPAEGLPRAPFGPFAGEAAVDTSEPAPVAADVPSPRGTDLVYKAGLALYLAVAITSGTAFGIGLADKMRAARDFRGSGGRGN
ncbi:MAG: hypothetical protein BJ554DRAFT_5009 [Olpidium bornovanus]|uniref:Uncharacterized protein n=1 Tax=Olpidium bornovanus TaxID=278681 RepID=A0A8H8DF37_9FUNG|nr:MAG: hypothetical protein BJ554DRAFT_5009 [Olpidium bornovanus]